MMILYLDPSHEIAKLHGFLELDPFVYDFDNIVAKDREKDTEVYGLPTMHEVRKKVKKISKPYTEVLSTEVINILTMILESAIDVRSTGQQFIKRKSIRWSLLYQVSPLFQSIFLCATTGRYCRSRPQVATEGSIKI